MGSDLPFLSLRDIRWRRSKYRLPQSINAGPLFEPGSSDGAFDAHDPHPINAFSKSILDPQRVVFGRIHTDHDFLVPSLVGGEPHLCAVTTCGIERGHKLRHRAES